MKKLGTSIAVFGGLVFASGIVLAPILDALTIDIIALFLMSMGMGLRSGKRQDIKWPAIWSGWYCAISALLLVLTIIVPTRVTVGKYHLHAGWSSLPVIATLSIAFVWSGLNFIGLLNARKRGIAEQSLGGDSENRAEDGTLSGAPQG